jgi:rubrerythrin
VGEEKVENKLFDLQISDKDKTFAQKALEVEVSNSTFYFCAAEKSDRLTERVLFRALAEVEKEHAIIWQKVLNLERLPAGEETCEIASVHNLKESHRREDMAIGFYREAAENSENSVIKMIFTALIEIETDHLDISQERIEKMEA